MVSRPLTLSAQLTLTLGAGLLAVGLIIGVAVHQGISRMLDSAIHDKAQSLARQLSIVVTDALLIYDYGTLERYAEGLVGTPSLEYLELRDSRGELLARAGQPRARSSADVVRIHQPIEAATSVLGEIILEYDRSDIPRQLERLALMLTAALFLIMGMLFWLLKRAMHHRVVRPIQALAESYNPLRQNCCPEDHDLPEELAQLSITFFGLCQEIQEHMAARDHAQKTAASALERLLHEQRLATLGQMAAGLAHALNTPLGNILGYAQMAGQETDDRTRQRLAVIEDQARLCDGIVRNLLTAARPPAPQLTTVELPALVAATVELTEPVLRNDGLEGVETRFDDPCRIEGDPAGVEQILFNLMTNATEAGASKLIITGEEHRDRVELAVADDGPGIPEDLRERLFEPFVTSKAPGRGTGLGLHLSRTLAREMGGDLTIADSSSRGTRLVVTLRAATGEDS